MPGATPSTILAYALLAALATALLVAAFTDLRRREIDNGLNLAIACAAPVWWLAAGFGWVDMAFQIALATVTFAVACLLFALRQMGGGDVKLLTALALWFTPTSFLQVVVLMAVLGGGASIAMAACNMKRVPGEAWRDAVAGLVALAWTWCALAVVFALAMRRPLVSPQTRSAIASIVPQGAGAGALLLGVVVVVAAVFLFGFRHIMRRQKSRLPIPYGIAIAAAGLWVLGEQALPALWLAGETG